MEMDNELFELANTRYVSMQLDDDDSSIETARSVDSCIYEPLSMSPLVDMAEAGDENFVNLSAFCQKSALLVDEAAFLLEKLKTCDAESLNNPLYWSGIFVHSQKWAGTSRLSELELVYYVLNKIESRPKQLHFKCKRLIEQDIQNIIQKCLTINPPYSSQGSLFRVTVKTEMPLGQFLRQLDNISHTTPGFELQTGIVTAILEQNNMIYRLLTPEVHRYADLESILSDHRLHKMRATVRINCAIRGRRHVALQIAFNNECNATNERRVKTIDIEQQVRNLNPTSRRVTFAPVEEHIIHEFEIPENAPFIPLIRSKRQVLNLIDYLNMIKTNMSVAGVAK